MSHTYTSTACQHDRHHDCRRVCKFCGDRCHCHCHPGTAADHNARFAPGHHRYADALTQNLDWIPGVEKIRSWS